MEGTARLEFVGIFMAAVHLMTAFCSSRLPETKGTELGAAIFHESTNNEHEDLTPDGYVLASEPTFPVSPSRNKVV